jgi:UDP-3-O-[3-hydroxymyristoyl] glucosamine N-acyltransferase
MRLREAAERIGGWVAPENYEKPVLGVASLDDANEGDISFYGSPKYVKALRKSRATAVLVPHGFAEEIAAVRVWVDNPKRCSTTKPRTTSSGSEQRVVSRL